MPLLSLWYPCPGLYCRWRGVHKKILFLSSIFWESTVIPVVGTVAENNTLVATNSLQLFLNNCWNPTLSYYRAFLPLSRITNKALSNPPKSHFIPQVAAAAAKGGSLRYLHICTSQFMKFLKALRAPGAFRILIGVHSQCPCAFNGLMQILGARKGTDPCECQRWASKGCQGQSQPGKGKQNFTC